MSAFFKTVLQVLSGTGRLAGTRAGALLVAVIVPFAASHAVVMTARGVGMPERLGLDLLHGVIVLAYLGAVLRIADGSAQGIARLGFAVPRPPCVGLWKLLAAGLVLAVLGVPAALALHPVIDALEGVRVGAAAFPAAMLPEFVMTTLIGLVLAAAGRKMPAMPVDVKICGINSAQALDAAVAGGAKMLGFVFFPKSPRCVTPVEAQALMERVPAGVTKVALMVDPDDLDVGALCRQLPIDMVQLHGAESLERVADIKAITGLPVMKAVGIQGADDIQRAHDYEQIADYILLDAKAPEGADLPGGNALSFDWELIRGETWQKPWLLAGGLNAANLAEAVNTSGAGFVDVSSGVEDAPGQKSPSKIKEFLGLASAL